MLAAEKLFTSRRFHEITLDDIVREAKVGKGTIYVYFKDKDDLFRQVAISGFDELHALLQRHIASNAPFEAQLLKASEAIEKFFERRKQLFRMIQSEDARMSLCHGQLKQEWQERRNRLVDSLGQILEKGRAAGRIRSDISPTIIARFLLSLLRSKARDMRDGLETIKFELLMDMFLSGASKDGAKAPSAETK